MIVHWLEPEELSFFFFLRGLRIKRVTPYNSQSFSLQMLNFFWARSGCIEALCTCEMWHLTTGVTGRILKPLQFA